MRSYPSLPMMTSLPLLPRQSDAPAVQYMVTAAPKHVVVSSALTSSVGGSSAAQPASPAIAIATKNEPPAVLPCCPMCVPLPTGIQQPTCLRAKPGLSMPYGTGEKRVVQRLEQVASELNKTTDASLSSPRAIAYWR